MNQDTKMIFLDLDGTLLDNEKKLPQVNREAMDAALEKMDSLSNAAHAPEATQNNNTNTINIEETQPEIVQSINETSYKCRLLDSVPEGYVAAICVASDSMPVITEEI